MKFAFTVARSFPFVARKAAPADTFETVMDDFFVARDRLEAIRLASDTEAKEAARRAAEADATARRSERARNALDNLLGLVD